MKLRTSRLFRVQLGLLGGLFAFTLSIAPVQAAQAETRTNATESILLSPTSKHYDLKAGASKNDKLLVVNDGQKSFNFAVYARPYSVNNELYVPDFTSTSQNADLYKWVSFDKTSFRLEPGQSVEVPYTLRVPASAAPGGHYGVIFAETQPSGDANTGSVVRKKRVGAIMYATVDGDVKLDGKSLGVNVPFFQLKVPLAISERINNTGNTDFAVTTTTEVTDVFGGVKHRSQKESSVLPGTTRQIVSDWQSPAWIGLYKVAHNSKFLDASKTSINYVLFVPLWVYLTLVLAIGARILYAVVHRKKKK